ncbi:Response regulator receiver domain-containing protein [Rhodospirillales bacterium URHD0017]|nr:Response regulator receiver domain-containing protein [Rhodospirillales bacterium URHD0017]
MTGTRVLVVEDESLLAETLCDLMRDGGCEPVGPAATVAEALRLIEQGGIDVALLDIRLKQETSFAVAYALRQRGIPWLFLTSYAQHQLPDDLGDALLVEKPFSPPALIETVRRLAEGLPCQSSVASRT